ncbi:PAS domain S-box protein [Rhodohalobacter sp. SW132]|uniref:PAS domain-containing sensor histidine kinase n=1 Tax=Rhodohalobacter sp. SW132 TaxID=2293433 RepID=UPI000E22228E|nr:PAS domain S-box protein [Rhodohalobacter sp. SW132]REL24535.1 PAS domain S-box protein [Rhodohalobacter sp. SW132]
MDSSVISDLIEELQKPGELNGTVRSKLMEVLRSYEERNVRDNLIKSLTEISKGMVSAKNWTKLLRASFRKLGKGILADRICYYELSPENGTGSKGMTLKVEWNSEHALEEFGITSRRILPDDLYYELFTTLQNRSPFQTFRSHQHKGELKNLMVDDGVNTLLLLPVILSDSLYGIIRIDTCKHFRSWSDREISLLQPIVFQVRNLLEKRNMEKQIFNIHNQARIGTWEMDLDNNGVIWSPITKEIFGFPPDTKPDMDMIMEIFANEESQKKVLEAVERAKTTGEPYDMELQVRTANGEYKWIRDTGQAEIRNGKCVRLYGIVQDIHKRKVAELESQKNKQLLEAITQKTDVAVWVRNYSGEIIFVNREWKKIFGLDKEHLEGKNVYDLFEKKVADDLIKSDRKVLQMNDQVVFEEYIDTAQGHRHYMVNKFPIVGIPGLEDAAGGIGTDITEIKKTEKQLQRAEQKLRDIIEHSTNLFYTHNIENELTYVSPQSVEFLGYEPHEARRRWIEFVTDHPANEYGIKCTQKAIETGKTQPPFELQLKKGNGEIIWVEVNEAPVVKDGKTVSIAGSLTDITERKKAQEAIKANLKEKNTLLAEIHHRVKNNLAVVASLMQLQAMESTSEELEEQLIESVLRIKSMASIHEHLYKTDTFSRLNFGNNLKGLISDIINTMQYSSQIDLKFEFEDVFLNVNQAIPSSLIINEVVTNIIKHGFKGLKSGYILATLSQTGDEITLKIEDNGRGFPDDFNPDSTNTLGMQLIKTLTTQLEGTYNYTSLDKGVRFSLTFQANQLPS